MAATPDVALELAVLSSVSFPTNKVHEVLVVSRRASPVYIGMAPFPCSTKSSNQVGATSFPSPVTTASLLPAATRELVADLVCPATKAINSIQSFRKHDLDFSPHTSHKDLGHGRCRGHHCGQLILQREWRLDPFCGLRLQSMCHQRSVILVLPIGTSR